MENNRLKKDNETRILNYFNTTYEKVVGDSLEIIKSDERPDFICKRKDGTLVGVELVQVRRSHPNDVIYDQCINKNLTMHPTQTLDIIPYIIYNKAEKIKSKDWSLPEKTILIIHLSESPLWEINEAILTDESLPDLEAYGFIEIWMADFSEIDAYNNIELLCLFPTTIRGYYERPLQKPYG